MIRSVGNLSGAICGILLLALLPIAGCQRKVAVQAPLPQPSPDPRIKELVLKGDEFFAHQNMYGWRVAEDFYAKAHALGGGPALEEKLLLTRVLLVTRQIDEDVVISSLKKNLASSCASPVNSTGQLLCDLAAKYIAPREAPEKNLDPAAAGKVPVFAPAEDTLNTYLYILYARSASIDLPSDFELSAWDKYKSSPLFMYLNLRKVAAQPTEEVEKTLPNFTELYVLNGEKRLQATHYRDSRTYFNRALELVPDYTRAINGLGNIFLYVVGDYVEALRFYERSLKYDPSNSGGLYGKGVVLHSMGQFADSNQVFDRLISTDLTRGGRLDDSNVRYYRGMGHYYQAYNNYKLFKPQESRALIDLAKKDLPIAEPVNFLSGVLYFNANEMENAERDFRQVLTSGSTNCDAYNYLGLISMPKDENRATQYFLGMCSCLDVAIQNTKRDVASLPRLDLEPAELNQVKARLLERLSIYRKSSVDMIKNALTLMDLISAKERDLYKKLMEETLQRIIKESEQK